MDPGRGRSREPATALTAGTPASGAAGDGAPLDVDAVTIRRAEPADADGIGDVWLASWRATFDFEPAYPDDICRRWLATEIMPRNETWVGVGCPAAWSSG